MIKKAHLLFALLTLLPFPAFARDCAEKDLNVAMTSPLTNMPVLDQDGSGSCYGHSAATLINYELLANGGAPFTGIHPLYGAWVEKYVNSTIKSDGLDSGEAVDVISSLKKKGYCSEIEVEKRLKKLKVDCAKGTTDAQLLHILELIYDNYSSFSFNPYANAVESAKKARASKKDYHITDCQIESVAAELRLKDMINIPATALLSKLFEGCKHEDLKVGEPKEEHIGSDEHMLNNVDNALNRDKPAEISICSKMFTDPNFKLNGVLPSVNRGSLLNIPSGCGGHSVVITGRKNVGGTCKYLLRNSWGSLWKADTATECACILNTGKYLDVCPDASIVREYLGCWFKEDILGKNIFGTTSF
ncbi:MAG TPA: hypothetical protein VNJ08_10235 [Bacteriovoracaceae bacterium]|nr:hypothetical protein [Bacteriovoracaceae bacterium]